MREINYRASDVAEKLSKYQTKLSQIYIRIFQQNTYNEMLIKKT
jgi:isoleucyl-tRNA synthetase